MTLCETGAIYGMTPFGFSCARGSQIAANLSVAAGAGFLVFLFVEVSGMVFAQLFQERRNEAAERRAAAAERRADTAELKAEIAELRRRLEVSDLSRQLDASERKAEVAELSRRIEVAEQARRAEAERAARLELELELARRNAAKNDDGESG